MNVICLGGIQLKINNKKCIVNLTSEGTNMKLPYWKPLKLLFDSPTTHMA